MQDALPCPAALEVPMSVDGPKILLTSYQNSWSECHQDVRKSLCQYDGMSEYQNV